MDVVRLETGEHHPENGFVSLETTSTGLLSRIDGCVLPFLGGFGKYQKQLIVLTWIPALFIGFSQFSDYFLLAQPNITCVQPTASTVIPTASSVSSFDGPNSTTAAPHFYNNGTRNESRSVQCLCNEWKYELRTGLVQNVVTKWNLVCDSAWKVHIAKFSLLVGSIFGYLVLGVLADWFGRRPVLITSVLFMLVFGLTVAFSVNVPMFSTLRFFEGFCLAGITLSLYVLRIELCLPSWRFRMTMVASFVVLAGQLLMPGLAALCRDWQVLQAIIVCPLLLMLSYIWIFPESLRWLLSTQQYCRAERQMDRIAKKNKVGELHTEEIFSEVRREVQKKPKKTCIVKMVGTRNLWKNIVVLCVNSLTGYGIHHCFARSMMDPEANETTMFHNFYADYYTTAGIAVASCMALCPAVGFMGRRGGLLMFMIITALASLLQLGLLNLLGKYSVQLNIDQSETLNKNFSIAFSIIGMFSSHAVSNLSIFFCAEITPTVIRGGGLGLVLASAGFGMLTAPIMELHNQKGYFLHHIIFACCTLICIICILLLPETRYQPLPESITDGESYYRQPLLPPKKPGEQDPLLNKSDNRDRPQGQDAGPRPGDDPSAADATSPCLTNAEPTCVVEATTPCDTDAEIPCVKDTTAPCVIHSEIPCAKDAKVPCDIDAEIPCVKDTTVPCVKDTEIPCVKDTTAPCVTDTEPPCVVDTVPPCVGDGAPPCIKDTASPNIKEATPPSVTETSLPSVVDTVPPCVGDGAPPCVKDTVEETANLKEATPPCIVDAMPSSIMDSSSPSVTDSAPPTGDAQPSAVDATPSATTDSAPHHTTDPTTPSKPDPTTPLPPGSTPLPALDTAPPSAADASGPHAPGPVPVTTADPAALANNTANGVTSS